MSQPKRTFLQPELKTHEMYLIGINGANLFHETFLTSYWRNVKIVKVISELRARHRRRRLLRDVDLEAKSKQSMRAV